jgi:UDP-N-acetylglucosamine 2-epimerase (non-hydrolysing)
MKIISVVGARPNFMKIAPFIRAVEEYNIRVNEKNYEIHAHNSSLITHLLVHTGQHYDDKMSRAFFKALDIPDADINLNVGSGSHAQQVGQTMMAFEKVVQDHKPDWVVVVGDVNATLACSVTAKKEWVRCCHIEAGLRSGDMTMPEEINRLVTDRLSDLLLTPDEISSDNLRKEGVPEDKIRLVGNIMIDTLEAQRSRAEHLSIPDIILRNLLPVQPPCSPLISHDSPLAAHRSPLYALITLHRPSNVDDPGVLGAILDFLCNEVCADMPLIWPIHPRTEHNLKQCGMWQKALAASGLVLLHPLGYHEMLRLNMGARIMLTDSGGLQEECTVLGTPCLTLRWNTERPVTLREHGGASVLVGNDVARIRQEYRSTLAGGRKPVRPKLWDGKTAQRCLEAILEASHG